MPDAGSLATLGGLDGLDPIVQLRQVTVTCRECVTRALRVWLPAGSTQGKRVMRSNTHHRMAEKHRDTLTSEVWWCVCPYGAIPGDQHVRSGVETGSREIGSSK